jgi:uncharacterized protein (TIGR00661 family)
MNIVYGVSGEGLGHVFEAIEITRRLREEGHAVKLLTYGERACAALGPLGARPIEGIHLMFDSRGMSLRRTLARNLGIFPYYLRHGAGLLRELREFRPDAFLTAYEPFTMVAAHLLGRPLVSMDNQNELLYIKAPPGGAGASFYLANLATRACTFGAAHYVVKSFTRHYSDNHRVHFVAPIIQREIRALRPVEGGHVLVYLTKENPGLIAVLKSMRESFVVYCLNRTGEDGNISYRRQGETYVRDLESCRAIIATTGFSLIADSLYLKKPYFGVPLRGQFEQTHNAHFLSESGLGECAEVPDRAMLEGFLARRHEYRARLQAYNLDPTEQEETVVRILAGLPRAA